MPITDARGTWETRELPSGVRVRWLVEPSESYRDARAAAAQAAAEADHSRRLQEMQVQALASARDLTGERMSLTAAREIVLDPRSSYADIQAVSLLFLEWEPGLVFTASPEEPGDGHVGSLLRYEGAVYEVLQPHTTQADWAPPVVPALFRSWRNPEEPGPWSIETSEDAYAKGERATHVGRLWQSLIPANTTEPGAVGSERYWLDLGPEPGE